MTTATVVDRSKARLTQAAQNTKKPDDRIAVASVPRAVFDRYWHLPTWDDVEQAAARGDDGLEMWFVMTIDRPPVNRAYLRAGLNTDGKLKGRALLFMQSWGRGD